MMRFTVEEKGVNLLFKHEQEKAHPTTLATAAKDAEIVDALAI